MKARAGVFPGPKSSSAEHKSFWFEVKGRLSNPQSELNLAADLLIIGLADIGFVFGTEVPETPRLRRKVTKRLTKADIDRLVAVYRGGASLTETARQFGVHWYTVQQHLKRRGVPRRVSSRKLSDDQVVEIKHLHELGVSYKELGRRYQVSPRTIKREIQSKRA